MVQIPSVKETVSRLGSSATIKLAVISILALALLIPTAMVDSLIRERESRQAEVVGSIDAQWGGRQTIAGPVIAVPYRRYISAKAGEPVVALAHIYLLPDKLEIKSDIVPEVRYRGIYESVVYAANLTMACTFSSLPVKALNIAPEDIDWSAATVNIGISDMRGISKEIVATHNGTPLQMAPGIHKVGPVTSGISAAIGAIGQHPINTFTFALNLNGSRQIEFTPVGKTTTVSARSKWKDPSFVGDFLPVERTIDDQGFSARWNVLHLNRNYPQAWKGDAYDIGESTFGVRLYNPVDIYQKTTRTAKYAFLFIALTFYAFFISEIINQIRIHPVQYLLIGFAMVIFYSLLLSLSEHLPFAPAYLLSAASVVLLISGYTRSIIGHAKAAVTAGGVLTLLYAYLFVLLHLEDFALLMGSIGLMAVLAAIMYLTRQIDWYALGAPSSPLPRKPLPDVASA